MGAVGFACEGTRFPAMVMVNGSRCVGVIVSDVVMMTGAVACLYLRKRCLQEVMRKSCGEHSLRFSEAARVRN